MMVAMTVFVVLNWMAVRKREILRNASDGADLVTLDGIVTNQVHVYAYYAIIALAVYGGLGRVKHAPHDVYCGCQGDGNCAHRWIVEEWTVIRRALQLGEEARWKDAFKLLRQTFDAPKDSDGLLVSEFRTVRLALMHYAFLRMGGPKTKSAVLTFIAEAKRNAWFLHGPLILAGAQCLNAQGDADGARQLLMGLSPWNEGTILANDRAELAAEVAAKR